MVQGGKPACLVDSNSLQQVSLLQYYPSSFQWWNKSLKEGGFQS